MGETARISIKERCEFLQTFLSKVMTEPPKPFSIAVRLDQLLRHVQELLHFIRYGCVQ